MLYYIIFLFHFSIYTLLSLTYFCDKMNIRNSKTGNEKGWDRVMEQTIQNHQIEVQNQLLANYATERKDICYQCTYHILWTTRYGRSYLALREYAAYQVKDVVRRIIRQLCEETQSQLHGISVGDNYVYLKVSIRPTLAVTNLVYMIKRESAKALYALIPELRSRTSSLWPRRYFVSTETVYPKQAIQAFVAATPKWEPPLARRSKCPQPREQVVLLNTTATGGKRRCS